MYSEAGSPVFIKDPVSKEREGVKDKRREGRKRGERGMKERRKLQKTVL